MKTKKFIATILCIILLFNLIPNIIPHDTSILPLDLYEEKIMD